MLTGSFLPDAMTLRLRTITRHRQSLVETVAKYTTSYSISMWL